MAAQRISFLSVVLVLLVSANAFGVGAKPNIVFIFTDDHCEQAISAYDPSRITTPNLDRIANEGMRFNRCYVTNSICGPSRAVIQTGKYSHINGFKTNRDRFNGDQQTFPKLLQASGYQTAIVGKWHLVSTPQGYDYYDVLKGQGPYYNPPMNTAAPSVSGFSSHWAFSSAAPTPSTPARIKRTSSTAQVKQTANTCDLCSPCRRTNTFCGPMATMRPKLSPNPARPAERRFIRPPQRSSDASPPEEALSDDEPPPSEASLSATATSSPPS